LIEIADTRKPFLPGEEYHFSISHCGDYAAAIVSRDKRVGVDIEIPVEKILWIKDKFLSTEELADFGDKDIDQLTLYWSAKEAVFKWDGNGGIDFREHIHLEKQNGIEERIVCLFSKKETVRLVVDYKFFKNIVLTWVI
jgi:phosphopantetheinyl transferase